jgi:hypothetical protein
LTLSSEKGDFYDFSLISFFKNPCQRSIDTISVEENKKINILKEKPIKEIGDPKTHGAAGAFT